jgi:hypothetical protein
MTDRERDLAFMVKAYDNVWNAADSSSVVSYLEIMVEEYAHQAKVLSGISRYEAIARLAAYEDCLRVLDIAADSALRHTPGGGEK